MRLVKVGLASVNTTVGAFGANVDRALNLAKAMSDEHVTVAVFPEQLVGGYPSEDLIQWHTFVERQWVELERFAKTTAASAVVHVLGVAVSHKGLRYNCAAVVAGGRILGLVPKEKLPTYGIFYEGRTFSRGYPGMNEQLEPPNRHGADTVPLGDQLFAFDFGTLGVEVCEDLWSADGPMRRRAYAGAELIVNVSSSPFRIGVEGTRRELVATRASDHQCTLAYANQVGSQDGLIFDGGGFLNQNGRPALEAVRFREGFSSAVVDLERTARLRTENTTWRMDQEAWATSQPPVPVRVIGDFKTKRETLHYPAPPNRSFFLPSGTPQRSAREALCEDLLDALSLGIGDYFEKNRVFTKIGIALSGGRDSTLTLLIAHRYAQRARPDDPGSLIQTFYMPTRFSSDATRRAAEVTARELGVGFAVVSIDDAFEREMEAAKQMLGPGVELTGITKQNIQARLRAQRMWNWANTSNGLFLQTGNMSEKAVGYTTIGGDLMGALAVISNLPKTLVVYLLEYLQEKHRYEGIGLVTAKPAGPELQPNQVGEEELMPFVVLDACFYLFAGEKLSPSELLSALVPMFPERGAAALKGDVEKFVRLFTQSIYKWVQSPLSLHVGNLDLDRERALQLPVVTKIEW
ncbi:MAG: NAD(+) synthase [Myxococcaceae bacterium]|nr:NAD(+) synthase [Myxococcaceae bacterium]